MSATPINPFGRDNPQRRDDWDDGFAAGFYEAGGRHIPALRTLERYGFRRCDIPACNCGGWHLSDANAHDARIRRESAAAERERICQFIEIHEPVNGTEWTRETVARVRALGAEKEGKE